jgi:carbonic anhydrase
MAGTGAERLLEGNTRWVKHFEGEPALKRLAVAQHPEFLLLHCCDSRVVPALIFDAPPGVIFSCATVANSFGCADHGPRAAVAYGVEHLNIKHVIVLGHTNCGGIHALASGDHEKDDNLGGWLAQLKDSKAQLDMVLALTLPQPEYERLLVECNVLVQLRAIKQFVQDLGVRDVHFYGWVYDLDSGIVRCELKHLASYKVLEKILANLGLTRRPLGEFV